MLLIDESSSKPQRALLDSVESFPVAVGDPLRLQFLFELSRKILKSKEAKVFPDLVTFAYFCRERAILSKLKCFPFLEKKRGWGTLIHIAPANVPINFAFSFLFGFLSGNANIVRLPTQSWGQVDLLLNFFTSLLMKSHYSSIKKACLFIRTEHDSPWLIEGVSRCDGLLVWGGDDTVSTFRSLPKSPRCVEMYFPNRVSSLIIDAASFLTVSDDQKLRILEAFYNDTYVTDQNACSSPSRILWVGSDSEILSAKAHFWCIAKDTIAARSYTLDPVARIDRYLDVMETVARVGSSLPLEQTAPDLWTQELSVDPLQRGRYGIHIQSSHSNLSSALGSLRVGEQTLTYSGVSPDQIVACLNSIDSSVDRVVPIGKALEMNYVWDGVNLLERFSRYTEIM